MRMNDKIKTLKEKLQKMKVNRGNRQTGQMFHFSPFSKKQKQVLTWWCKESPVHSKDHREVWRWSNQGKTTDQDGKLFPFWRTDSSGL